MAISGLGPLGAVLGAGLAPLGDAGGVQAAAHDVVAHTRQILDATAANQHHRVLLQIVAFAADVAGHFLAVGQADTRNLAQRGIGLLRRRGVDAGTNAALLRAAFERRHVALGFLC
jgi:hypothetical protein